MNRWKQRRTDVSGVILLSLLAVLFLTTGAIAQGAKAPPEMKSLFVLGNVNATFNYPLQAYIINGDELIHAETWSSRTRGIGPVGLTVDEVNEQLFVSYESEDTVDVFDARNMTPLGGITLPGTGNPAGMTVHEDNGVFYVVNRIEPTIYEFDSDTFAPLGQWDAACGIYDLDLTGDVLFVSCEANGIRAYDIDTHAELGSYDILAEAIGLGTTDYPENLVLATGYVFHQYLIKYEIDTGLMSQVYLGEKGHGVAMNPALNLAYVTVAGSGALAPAKIKVVDTDTMTEVRSYPINFYWSPTGIVASSIPFGGTVQKSSTSHPNGEISFAENMVFEIKVENNHTRTIDVLPLKDTYDQTQLTYVSANPAPDTINPGELIWDDLTSNFGQNLNPGQSFEVTVNFIALPQVCDPSATGANLAQMVDALDDQGVTLVAAAGQFDYTIDCVCQTNTDCDDGSFCNGLEFCDPSNECQRALTEPCLPSEYCDEIDDACYPGDDDDDDDDDDTADDDDDDDDDTADDDDDDDDTADDDDDDDDTVDDDDDDDDTADDDDDDTSTDDDDDDDSSGGGCFG
jgi:DNA-binding beta-propeller fold protein YncE